jgi:hypothetical protein
VVGSTKIRNRNEPDGIDVLEICLETFKRYRIVYYIWTEAFYRYLLCYVKVVYILCTYKIVVPMLVTSTFRNEIVNE